MVTSASSERPWRAVAIWLFTQHGFVSYVKYDPSHDVTGVHGRFMPGYSKWLDSTVRTENPGASRRAEKRVRTLKDKILNEGVLLVRARVAKHLDQLVPYYSEFVLETDPQADYKYRGLIPLRCVQAWMTGELDEVQYNSHFKEQFRDNAPEGSKWYSALMSVWSTLNSAGSTYTSSSSYYGSSGSYSGSTAWTGSGPTLPLCNVRRVSMTGKDGAAVAGGWCDKKTDGHGAGYHSFQLTEGNKGKPIPLSTDMEPYLSDPAFSTYQKKEVPKPATKTVTPLSIPAGGTSSLSKDATKSTADSDPVVAAAKEVIANVDKIIKESDAHKGSLISDFVSAAGAILLVHGVEEILMDTGTPQSVTDMTDLVLSLGDLIPYGEPLTLTQLCAILLVCSESELASDKSKAQYNHEFDRWTQKGKNEKLIADATALRDEFLVSLTVDAGQSGSTSHEGAM